MSKTYAILNCTKGEKHEPVIISGKNWQDAAESFTGAPLEQISRLHMGIKMFWSNNALWSLLAN